MIGQDSIQRILDSVLWVSKADETEARLTAEDLHLTRFANNLIHQNVSEANATLTVRAVMGKRQGTATTNDLSAAGIEKAAAQAREIALAQAEDPAFPGLPEAGTPPVVESFDEATASFSPEDRARAVSAVCRMAAAKKLTAAGAFKVGARELAVSNSRGLRAYHAGTYADFVTTVMSDDSAGRAQCSGWRARDMDTEATGQEAVRKAERGRNPRALEPKEYPVVFDDYAVEDMVSFLCLVGADGLAVHEGRSWMTGRAGQAAMRSSVTIWDDGCDPRGLALPFDAEGATRQRATIVEKGLVGSAVYDRATAAKAGAQATGHAAPSEIKRWGIQAAPLNVFMAEGDSSVADMIRSTERGLYCTRFWYTRTVRSRECLITGMTRDGLFWIERGEIAYPVKNLRFTQSYVKAFAEIEAIGSESKFLLSDSMFAYGYRVPPVKVASFNFTGATQ